MRFRSFALRDKQAREISALTCGGDSTIELVLHNPGGKSLNQLTVSIGIDDELGVRVAQLSNELTGQSFSGTDREQFTVGISIPRLPLKQGRYNMTVFASVGGEVADWIQDAIILDVDAGDFYGSGKLPPDGQGHLCIDHRFEIKNGN